MTINSFPNFSKDPSTGKLVRNYYCLECREGPYQTADIKKNVLIEGGYGRHTIYYCRKCYKIKFPNSVMPPIMDNAPTEIPRPRIEDISTLIDKEFDLESKPDGIVEIPIESVTDEELSVQAQAEETSLIEELEEIETVPERKPKADIEPEEKPEIEPEEEFKEIPEDSNEEPEEKLVPEEPKKNIENTEVESKEPEKDPNDSKEEPKEEPEEEPEEALSNSDIPEESINEDTKEPVVDLLVEVSQIKEKQKETKEKLILIEHAIDKAVTMNKPRTPNQIIQDFNEELKGSKPVPSYESSLYIYIAQGRNGLLYTDYTENVEEKIRWHNQNHQPVCSLRKDGFPVQLVYKRPVDTVNNAKAILARIRNIEKSQKQRLISNYKTPPKEALVATEKTTTKQNTSAKELAATLQNTTKELVDLALQVQALCKKLDKAL